MYRFRLTILSNKLFVLGVMETLQCKRPKVPGVGYFSPPPTSWTRKGRRDVKNSVINISECEQTLV